MGANLDLIRATYEGSSEQSGQTLLAALAANATWTEAEGFPYAGAYRATRKSMRAAFAHLFEVRNGQISSTVQYVDTAVVNRALIATSDQP